MQRSSRDAHAHPAQDKMAVVSTPSRPPPAAPLSLMTLKPAFAEPLAWIDAHAQAMLATLRQLAEVNSFTHHPGGLAAMESELSGAFAALGGTCERIALAPATTVDSYGQIAREPLGHALLLTKRPTAPIRVLLSIHYDTVFAP